MNKMVKYKGYVAGRLSQRAVLKLVWLSLVKKYSGKKDVRKITRKNKTALKNLKLIHFLSSLFC